MASPPPPKLPLVEIGPDGIARESPVIAYTEKIIEEEQLQLKRYIQENYSKIRDVERELEALQLELKLTAGPKKAALEHMRKKIEASNEKVRVAKIKEEQAKKVWEAAAQAVKDEEAVKEKLCEDLNKLVQESTNAQFSRLEELKRRMESLNRGRMSVDVSDAKSMQQKPSEDVASKTSNKPPVESPERKPENATAPANSDVASEAQNLSPVAGKEKKKILNSGRAKGNLILPKARPPGTGWTGAGFE